MASLTSPRVLACAVLLALMPVEARSSPSGTNLLPLEKPTIFPSGKRPPQGPELLRREDPIQILSITPPLLGERGNNMAIRYVKDFEFPSAAGFTSSAPSKVTGPIFAKGGKVEKEPKGLMVVIGLGKPKAEAKKSRGGPEYMDKGPDTSVPVKGMKGTKKQSTDEDFYGKAKDAPMPPRRPSMMKKGGYAEGGSADKTAAFEDKVKTMTAKIKALKDKGLDVDKHFAEKATEDARKAYDKSLYGGGYAKGGKVHDDAAQDKAMIKSMIKPSALKKAMGGPAVQMAKSNAVEASMKGQKKTGYADGGMASPLQQMGRKAVPVAPRAPMIPQQAGANGPRIGVGRSRSGKPDVGAIRAAMSRAASQAMPENAPSMMKKGGKVGC